MHEDNEIVVARAMQYFLQAEDKYKYKGQRYVAQRSALLALMETYPGQAFAEHVANKNAVAAMVLKLIQEQDNTEGVE